MIAKRGGMVSCRALLVLLLKKRDHCFIAEGVVDVPDTLRV